MALLYSTNLGVRIGNAEVAEAQRTAVNPPNPIGAQMNRYFIIAVMCAIAVTCAIAVPAAAEPITLMGTIVKWQYPDAVIDTATMSDAATINADGDRTVPSTEMKTTMVTDDSVDKVIAFYRELLTRNNANDERLGIQSDAGRSVIFSDESEGRPFEFHTILVNSENRSTTLIITRGKDEEKTHITWKRYLRHPL